MTAPDRGGSLPGGVLFLVVGPSGVGKDSLLDAARERLSGDADFMFAQRTITRPADAGGEDHKPISEAEFARAQRAGAFVASWQAHGLSYGVPREILPALERGQNVLVNGSRAHIAAFVEAWANTVVLSVVASPEVVAARLRARGREDASTVAARLARAVPIRGCDRVVEIANDGTLAQGVERFVSAVLGAANMPLQARALALSMGGADLLLVNEAARVLEARQLASGRTVEVRANGARPIRARLLTTSDAGLVGRHDVGLSQEMMSRLNICEGDAVTLQRARPAASRDVLRKKVAGETLSAGEIGRVVRDLVEGRYEGAEVAGFLVAASKALDLEEIVALTRARAELGEAIAWDHPHVVDKHSMGGVPGSRITLIVVPIVAAHGLKVPKTSSRAITSAAGTADVMECIARVDLTRDALKRVVDTAGAAMAWNGRISQSPLDDVMNAINRPLRIRSAALDVSSILSKKMLSGASHVVVDIPAGPSAKLATRAAGEDLAALFEAVGRGVGLHVEARVSDGSRPIGRAIGPALELSDVMAVLSNEPGGCIALREKALTFAGVMLEWDPAVPEGTGRERALGLLQSGAALEAFDKIVAAQGQVEQATPGVFSRTITATRAGEVAAADCYRISGLARAAGAPADKGAGAHLLVSVGQQVSLGEPLATVVASNEDALDRAMSYDTDNLFIVS